ncbi:DUF4178 domain-containing protein [uncultured Tenacibaculum sp.]|uniref:DUF4178 domain-containing protein n=1 Tax=uncultured Tenacibaculum sp. TaxID=174713 RepID=UPI00260C3229|nr:DUF4178 domain-containing protein [uncultured Tenacibaculum sp.]
MFGTNSNTNDLNRLKVGSTFKLYNTSWEVTEIGEYNWRMENSSTEYVIRSSDREAYLEVELHKGELELTFSEQISIETAILESAIETKQLLFDNKLFELEERYSGDYKNLTFHTSRENLDCFLFYTDDDELITIERWDDNSFEVFLGEELKSKKIKNIKL